MTTDHSGTEPRPTAGAADDAQRWDTIRSTDDPRQRAAAIGAELEPLTRAARALQWVLVVIVTIGALVAIAATVLMRLDPLTVILGDLVAMISYLVQTMIVVVGGRVRGGSVVAAVIVVVGTLAQFTLVVTALLWSGIDRALAVGLICGSISILFGQWAAPLAAVGEIRRRIPRPSIVGFAHAPRWMWAPDGRLGALVAIGALGMVGAIVETIAVVVAVPAVVLIWLFSALCAVVVSRVAESPRRIAVVQVSAILVNVAIIAVAVAIHHLAASV